MWKHQLPKKVVTSGQFLWEPTVSILGNSNAKMGIEDILKQCQMWIYMKILIIMVPRVVNVVTSRYASNVQCPHLATLINTSFQVFTVGISHVFSIHRWVLRSEALALRVWLGLLISRWSSQRKHTEDWGSKGWMFQQLASMT